ncbi:AMED_5909 family protein [Allokutzneria multivorans]
MKVETLREAHEVLRRLRPVPGAQQPELWREFYRRSEQVYAHVADIDRRHHHEALYWVSHERQKAAEFEEART